MKIALLQLKVLEKNREGNIAHGLQLAAAAAKEHHAPGARGCTQ